MNTRTQRTLVVIAIILTVIVIDQSSKYWIKTHMYLGQNIPIFGLTWANLHFVENKGMAFGLSFGGTIGKIVLTVFRIITVAMIMWYIHKLLRSRATKIGIVIALGLICAGAIGNIIDSVFYGLVFSESKYGQIASWMPESGGYAPILQGKVVDMFYFPLFELTLPKWIPLWGGDTLHFFRHVFNVADASITIGILIILLFHRKDFFHQTQQKKSITEED